METVETIIVGGGQAGLATSYYLTQHGREHVVLEQADRPAHVWRDDRWDSFTLVTPNWTLRMPGAEHDGADRDGFMPRDEVVDYFDRYVERFHLPVRYNTRVISVEPRDGAGLEVQTEDGVFRAENVVLATSLEQFPNVPAAANDLPAAITQLHSSRYRNPNALPPGGVLVVGSAQSGCQIAEELYLSGRQVFLCTGSTGRAPRRYRGKDTFEWLFEMGFFDLTPDKFPFPTQHFTAPHLSGTMGGHTLNLHQFARDGVTLLGHLRGASGDKISLMPDLYENLTRADQFEANGQKMIDGYIQARVLDAPVDKLPQLLDGFDQPIVEELDLKTNGINTVIWATGFSFDFSLVKAPILDDDGFPIQDSGVARIPGLYFVGMPWMPNLKPGILAGVRESAEHIATMIVEAGAGERRGRAVSVA
jgi:putative flavoprotein involved in K+ transport